MATGAGAVNLNINLRKDARPEELLKELALSPLIYIRLAGIVSILNVHMHKWRGGHDKFSTERCSLSVSSFCLNT